MDNLSMTVNTYKQRIRHSRNDFIYCTRGEKQGKYPYAACLLLICSFGLSVVDAWSRSMTKSLLDHSYGYGDIIGLSGYKIKPCSCHELNKCKTLARTLMRENVEGINDLSIDEKDNLVRNDDVQWQLFLKHHARYDKQVEKSEFMTSWFGKWTTYDYVGDIVLETRPASVNYSCRIGQSNNNVGTVDVTHTISYGSTTSDCDTCFDDPNKMRTIPITTFTQENISINNKLGACGMVTGPSIMRSSGTMATELILSHTNSRVRIVFQHAPVWTRGVEPGSCPPQGLKLIRCLVAREVLDLSPSSNNYPSLSEEQIPGGTEKHPIFDRSVPPFDWHKKWSGTSWTWGPEAGDRGWSIPELEIGVDDWHGCAPVEAWNLRLPGGIFIQLPRVITSDAVERCRLAWMPDADTLLRLEAGVLALQPIVYDDDDSIAGFEPPTLASYRCDILQNEGDLEGVPSFVQQQLQERQEERKMDLQSTSNGNSEETTSMDATKSVIKNNEDNAIYDSFQL